VGKRIMMNSVEELVHIVWADKIEWLAAAIPDTNSLLISTICRSMPKVLLKLTGSGHTNRATFCMAIHMATLAQIIKAKQEEEEACDLKEQVRKLQELCKMSTQDVTNALQWLTMSTPSPSPCFPTLRMQPTSATNNQPPACTTYQMPNQPVHRQN
jgi:hypothetical protein